MMKAETGDHDIGPTGCDDESQGKGKSLRPRSIPFNFRHLNELANVGNWAPPLTSGGAQFPTLANSFKRVEAQPELTSLFTAHRRSLNSKFQ